jgi:RNA polymerase sigma-70 factor (ECF subfamily)
MQPVRPALCPMLRAKERPMGKEDQDAECVARVVAGDLSGFEAIVQRWQHRVLILAWRFCRDRATAEDMAQEVFLRVFRSLALFRGDSAFSTWLMSIALNTFRSRLRAEGQPLLSLDPDRLLATTPGALRGLEEHQRAEAVRRAVLTLPKRYRDAILVYYFEEKGPRGICTDPGCGRGHTEGSVAPGTRVIEAPMRELGSAPCRSY